MRILVTGGAGFIGSALIRHLIAETEHEVLNLDKLTYAGDERSLDGVAGNNRYAFRSTASRSRPMSRTARAAGVSASPTT